MVRFIQQAVKSLSSKDLLYSQIINSNNRYEQNNFANLKMKNINNVQGEVICIEIETYKNFKKLQKKFKHETGIDIGIKYAYRSEQDQQKLYEEFCLKYGEEYANKIVCPIGFSEHHTGLCIDVEVKINNEWVSNNEHPEITFPILERMHRFLPQYGFILRYPKKTFITNMPYEPWHIRYVGKKIATFMRIYNLTLEELHADCISVV